MKTVKVIVNLIYNEKLDGAVKAIGNKLKS